MKKLQNRVESLEKQIADLHSRLPKI
jgi:polyhydroxyalkanoate synthesis regulator phasin